MKIDISTTRMRGGGRKRGERGGGGGVRVCHTNLMNRGGWSAYARGLSTKVKG